MLWQYCRWVPRPHFKVLSASMLWQCCRWVPRPHFKVCVSLHALAILQVGAQAPLQSSCQPPCSGNTVGGCLGPTSKFFQPPCSGNTVGGCLGPTSKFLLASMLWQYCRWVPRPHFKVLVSLHALAILQVGAQVPFQSSCQPPCSGNTVGGCLGPTSKFLLASMLWQYCRWVPRPHFKVLVSLHALAILQVGAQAPLQSSCQPPCSGNTVGGCLGPTSKFLSASMLWQYCRWVPRPHFKVLVSLHALAILQVGAQAPLQSSCQPPCSGNTVGGCLDPTSKFLSASMLWQYCRWVPRPHFKVLVSLHALAILQVGAQTPLQSSCQPPCSGNTVGGCLGPTSKFLSASMLWQYCRWVPRPHFKVLVSLHALAILQVGAQAPLQSSCQPPCSGNTVGGCLDPTSKFLSASMLWQYCRWVPRPHFKVLVSLHALAILQVGAQTPLQSSCQPPCSGNTVGGCLGPTSKFLLASMLWQYCRWVPRPHFKVLVSLHALAILQVGAQVPFQSSCQPPCSGNTVGGCLGPTSKFLSASMLWHWR